MISYENYPNDMDSKDHTHLTYRSVLNGTKNLIHVGHSFNNVISLLIYLKLQMIFTIKSQSKTTFLSTLTILMLKSFDLKFHSPVKTA